MIEPILGLSATDRAALSAFVDGVRAALSDELIEVRLFGSKARGGARADSDLDVFVVIDAPTRWPIAETISDIAFDVNLQYGVFISPVVLTSAALADERQSQSPFIRSIRAEGVLL